MVPLWPFFRFLLKPVSPSILFDTIMQAFGEAVPETSRVAQRHGQEAEALKYIRGARALLVEDNEINQQVELEILESARSLVHDLKGIAGNLSAVDLLAAVTDLWSLLKAQDPEKDITRDALDQKILDLHNNLRHALNR